MFLYTRIEKISKDQQTKEYFSFSLRTQSNKPYILLDKYFIQTKQDGEFKTKDTWHRQTHKPNPAQTKKVISLITDDIIEQAKTVFKEKLNESKIILEQILG